MTRLLSVWLGFRLIHFSGDRAASFREKSSVNSSSAYVSPAFDGLEFEPRQSMKYRSEFDVIGLIRHANRELGTSDPAAYMIFLLAVTAGLHRKEIDLLQWPSFRFKDKAIWIEPTQFFHPKSQDSIGEVQMDLQTNNFTSPGSTGSRRRRGSLLTDILPTGYTAIEWSQLTEGETVAVFGCGAVGLMAQKVAQVKGARKAVGIDREAYRLAIPDRVAEAETINFEEEDPIERIREMTDGSGADVCVDAVGLEAQSIGSRQNRKLTSSSVGQYQCS